MITSQIASTALGNTISNAVNKKFRKFIFTLNNYEEDDINSISQYFSETSKKYIFGKEIAPKTGTKHLQGYVEFKNQKTIITIKNNCKSLFKAHFEPAKGSLEHNYNYCSKENEFFTNIVMPEKIKVLKSEDLYSWQKSLINILDITPNNRTIIWIYDKYGNMGKTSLLKYLFNYYNCIFTTGGKQSDVLNLCLNNQDKLLLPKCIVIWALTRSFDYSYLNYGTMETIKDGIICNTKYETKSFICNSPHLVVMANELPNLEKMSLDRWELFVINPNRELERLPRQTLRQSDACKCSASFVCGFVDDD